MSSYASEESFKVYSGNELLMTSPTFANNELRDIEYCLPATQNNQYTIQLLDSGKDSWQSGSWVRIAGVYGNTVFRNLMSDANKEDYSFSLYYAIAKNQQWKAFSSTTTIDTAWMSPSFSDGEWQDATLGSFETSLTGTQYFRKHFTSIADMAAYELQMNYRYGIIAYLNGKEIFRDHMPAGAVTPATLSDGAFPSTAFYGVIRPASEMVVGDNVLAVELHFPAVVSTFVDFEAFLALLAPSVPVDPCFIYGDEVSLSAEVGSNVENIFDFARNNFYTVPFGQFPSAVTYAFRGSQPFVNGIRIFPYTGYAASPGSFAWEGKHDQASAEWTSILTATGVTYTSSTYRSFFSYLAAGLYRSYRFDIRAAAATSYGRAYEVQPLVCSFSAPSSIEFEQPAYSFFADYDEVTVRPKVIEFTNCTVTPALPAGLTLDVTTCVISGKSAVASSGTYEVTSETYGQTYRGSFALELVACNGMLASVVRTYKSDAYLESFTITDASSQQVVLSVAENAGQVSHQEWSAVVCLTGAKYTVAVSTSTNYWESMSFLYVRAVLSGDAYETVLRAHYDANLGIPAVRSFYGQWAVAPKGSWEYKMGEVPAGWQNASGWETASMGSYPASTNTIQLYKKTFTVDSVENVSGVVISLRYLYGCVVYLNGHEAFRNGVTGELTASSVGLNAYTDLLYRQISLPVKTMVFDDTPAVNYVQQGTNVIAIAIVAQTTTQTASVFDCAVRLMGEAESSRLFENNVLYGYIQGNPSLVANQHYDYAMYYNTCNTNYWTAVFNNDRREWISSVTLYLHYQQADRQPRQFTLKARNTNQEEWTVLKEVTGMTWSLVGQHKKIWLENNKPYNQYRFENFATGDMAKCPWRLGSIDMTADATATTVPELSYPSPVVVSKDVEMGEVYPNSAQYFDFTVTPALPAGLSLDPSTGMISGTAHEVVTQAAYTVEAKRVSGGRATAVVEISVEVCTGGKSLITLVVRTDSYPERASYKVFAGRGTNGEVVAALDKFVVKNALSYGDFCLPHGLYTAQMFDSAQSGWGSPAGWWLSVDVGEMVFETGQVPRGVESVSTVFSSLLPFQVEYDEWRLFNSENAVSENWKAVEFDDSEWQSVKAGAMGNHVGTTAYIRHEVTIPSLEDYHVLNVRVKYVGGVVVYFNGRTVARFNLADPFTAATEATTMHDASAFSKFHVILSTVGAVEGKNVIAFEVHRTADQSELVFDATGVFGVNDCSPVLDSFAALESSAVSTTTIAGLFDLKTTAYGYLANAAHAYAQWTVENLEGSKWNSFAMQTILDREGYGFSVYGRFAEADEFTTGVSVAGQATPNRGRAAWPMPVGIAGFRQFKFEVDVAASGTVTMYAFVPQYCRASGSGACPAVGDFPAVGEGEISPGACPEGFYGYAYRECTGGQLSDVHTERCAYKEPANLEYATATFVFVKDVKSSSGAPSFSNLITEFYVQEDTPLPAGFAIDAATGEITGVATSEFDAVRVVVRGKNPSGETLAEISIAARLGYCPPEGLFERTPVGEDVAYACSQQGNYVGTQHRLCVLGEKDGEWQKVRGSCVSVSVVVVGAVVAIIIIAVVIYLIVRSSRKAKAVGGVRGKQAKENRVKAEKQDKRPVRI